MFVSAWRALRHAPRVHAPAMATSHGLSPLERARLAVARRAAAHTPPRPPPLSASDPPGLSAPGPAPAQGSAPSLPPHPPPRPQPPVFDRDRPRHDAHSHSASARMRTKAEERKRMFAPEPSHDELRQELPRALSALSAALDAGNAARAEFAFYELLDTQQYLFGDRWASPFILLRSEQINRLISLCATPPGLAGAEDWEDCPDNPSSAGASTQHDSSGSGSERIRDRGAAKAAFRCLAILERLSKSLVPSPVNPAVSKLGDDLSVMTTHSLTLQRILFSPHLAPRPPQESVTLTGSKDETVLERILHLISRRSNTISRLHLEEALFVLRTACPPPYPVLQPARSLVSRNPRRAHELAYKIRDAARAAGVGDEPHQTLAGTSSATPRAFSINGRERVEWRGGQPSPGKSFLCQYQMRQEHSRNAHIKRMRFQQYARPRVFLLMMDMAARATPRARHVYQYSPSQIKRRLEVIRRLLDMPLGGYHSDATSEPQSDANDDPIMQAEKEKAWLRDMHLMSRYTEYEVRPEVAPQRGEPDNSADMQEKYEGDEEGPREMAEPPESDMKPDPYPSDSFWGGYTPLTPPGIDTALGTIHLRTFVDELEGLLADEEAASDASVPTRPRRRYSANPNDAEKPRQRTWTADHSLRVIECAWTELMRSLMLPSAVQGAPASAVPMKYPSSESGTTTENVKPTLLSDAEAESLRRYQGKIMGELGSRLHRILVLYAFKSLTLDAIPLIIAHAARTGRLDTSLVNMVLRGFRLARPQLTLEAGQAGEGSKAAMMATKPIPRPTEPAVRPEREEYVFKTQADYADEAAARRETRRTRRAMSAADLRREWSSHLAIGLVSYERVYRRELGLEETGKEEAPAPELATFKTAIDPPARAASSAAIDAPTETALDVSSRVGTADADLAEANADPMPVDVKEGAAAVGTVWDLEGPEPKAEIDPWDDPRVFARTDEEPSTGWLNHEEVPWRTARLTIDPAELVDEQVEAKVIRVIYEAMRDGALRNELLSIKGSSLDSPSSTPRPQGLRASLHNDWARLLDGHRSETESTKDAPSSNQSTCPWALGGPPTASKLPAPVLTDRTAHGLSHATATPAQVMMEKWLGVATLPPQAIPDQDTYVLAIQCFSWQSYLGEAFGVLQAMIQTPLSSGRFQPLSLPYSSGKAADPTAGDDLATELDFISSAIEVQHKYEVEREARQAEEGHPSSGTIATQPGGLHDVEDETFSPSLAIYDGIFRGFARHGVGARMVQFDPSEPSKSKFELPWEVNSELYGMQPKDDPNPWNVHAFSHIFEAFLRLPPRASPRREGWKDVFKDDLGSSLAHLDRILQPSIPFPHLPKPSSRLHDPTAPFFDQKVGPSTAWKDASAAVEEVARKTDPDDPSVCLPTELLSPEPTPSQDVPPQPALLHAFHPPMAQETASAAPSATTFFWLLTALRVVSNDEADWVLAQWERVWSKFNPQVPWLISARARREAAGTPGVTSNALTKYGVRRANMAGVLFLKRNTDMGSLWHTTVRAQAQPCPDKEYWINNTLPRRTTKVLSQLLARSTLSNPPRG